MNDDTASSTALIVMQGILITAKKAEYSGLVSDALFHDCYNILSSSLEGRKKLSQLESWWGRKLLAFKENMLMPGITLHYVLRKRYIEEYVVKAIEQGAEQVINLGAGFDTLLFRLSKKYPGVNFIEVDHPVSQAAKLNSLVHPTFDSHKVNFLSMCFEKDNLHQQLLSTSFFSKKLKTIYIIEGVLMYLREQIIKQVFSSLTGLSGINHQVIFTTTEPFLSNPQSSNLLFKMYLALVGEPLAWSCKKEHLSELLQLLEYQLLECVGAKEFKCLYLNKSFTGRLPTVEYIAVAKPVN